MQHYTMHTLNTRHAKLEQYPYLHAEVLEEIQYSGEGEGSDIFQHLSTISVYVRNSRERKSDTGVGNVCAPHPLNESLLVLEARFE